MQSQVKGNASALRYPGDATDADTRVDVELSNSADDEVAKYFLYPFETFRALNFLSLHQ